ncbi:hypothetical protein HELRODRAFT_169825 [Helobdella robusta]|uniref:Spindle and centriole-associated protein 1 n=1 Tax=Helobdella robusta TaxID=6412 RepID=T1F2C7_HELRO|nr:hypothetical protein HELRODRAFT_169825 [Helobdella robusta]ESO08094.1 hypothetical protein HELRODRAFT_169825 [Helobdella robusta]
MPNFKHRRSQSCPKPFHSTKVRKSRKPDWDDTVSDLSVYRPSKEQLAQRKLSHQSSNSHVWKEMQLQKKLARIQRSTTASLRSSKSLTRRFGNDDNDEDGDYNYDDSDVDGSSRVSGKCFKKSIKPYFHVEPIVTKPTMKGRLDEKKLEQLKKFQVQLADELKRAKDANVIPLNKDLWLGAAVAVPVVLQPFYSSHPFKWRVLSY